MPAVASTLPSRIPRNMQQYIDFVIKEWVLFALLAAVVVLFIGNEVLRVVRGTSAVSVTEALNLFNRENALMLDIQEVEEFRNGHLPDARGMPLSTLKERLGELKISKDRPIVVYCRSGNRSVGACSILKKQGFENVQSLSGGLLAWQNANLPTAKGRK